MQQLPPSEFPTPTETIVASSGGSTNLGVEPTPTPSAPVYTVTGFVYLDDTLDPSRTVILTTPASTSITLTAPKVPGYSFVRWERHVSNFSILVSISPSFTVDVAYSDLVYHAYYIFGALPEPSPSAPPKFIPTPTPTPEPSTLPKASVTPSPTPAITPTPTPPLPSPSPSASLPPKETPLPLPSATPNTPAPTPPPQVVEIGDALRVTQNSAEFVYDKGSHVVPQSVTVQLTNLFSDSTLTINISSPYVSPSILTLGANETKSVTITVSSVEYLESLPFGDTLGSIPVLVSRTIIPTPVPLPPPTPTPEPILGCTDPAALNYNSSATQNDGSCMFAKTGCRDPRAVNYDPQADTEIAGSCRYKLALQKVSGDQQTVIDPSGQVPQLLMMRVVQIDADSGVTTPVSAIPVLIQTNGSLATITDINNPVNMTSTASDSDGNISVSWKIDMINRLPPQARFSIASQLIPPQFTIVTPSAIFSATNAVQTPLTSGTPQTPGVTPIPTTPIPSNTITIEVDSGPYPQPPGPAQATLAELLSQRPLAPTVTLNLGGGKVLTATYPSTILYPAPIGTIVNLSVSQPANSAWTFYGWVDGHTHVNDAGNTVFDSQPDLANLPPNTPLSALGPAIISANPAFSYIVPADGFKLYALYQLPVGQIPPIAPITVNFDTPIVVRPEPTPTPSTFLAPRIRP